MENEEVILVLVEPKIDPEADLLEDTEIKTEAVEYLISDNDEEYVPPKKKSKHQKKSTTTRRRFIYDGKNYVSRVNEICHNNPKLRDDETALITFIVEEMQNLEVPPLGPDCYKTLNTAKFCCNFCNVTKITKGDIERHWQEYHGPRYLFCMACGADFRSKTNLFRHEKKCKAPEAGYVRKARAVYVTNQSKARRDDHPDIVVPRKSHRCDICFYNFSTKSSLACHQKKHYPPTKSFENISGKYADANPQLAKHVWYMNSIGRKYVCRVCGKGYKCSSALYKHKWKHLNETFICDYCGMTCTNKVIFIQHIKLHTPRHPCPHCPLKFSYNAGMKYHVRREHLGLPPPALCTLCFKRFCSDRSLRQHMKKVHKLVIITRQMLLKSLARKEMDMAVDTLKSNELEITSYYDTMKMVMAEKRECAVSGDNDVMKVIFLDDKGNNDLPKLLDDYQKVSDKSNTVIVQDGKIVDPNEETLKIG